MFGEKDSVYCFMSITVGLREQAKKSRFRKSVNDSTTNSQFLLSKDILPNTFSSLKAIHLEYSMQELGSWCCTTPGSPGSPDCRASTQMNTGRYTEKR